MSHDISKSVSQGSIGAQDAENSRIEAFANELRRRCELYEAQRGDSQPHVSLFEIEQRAAEVYAKENGLWLTMEEVFDLGVPGPSGNENDTYFSDDIVYKVNNLLNCGSILHLLDKVKMHNEIFPDTFYQLHAFTGFDASQTLVVGDMDVDILMGANAGAKTCGVTYGNGTKSELEEAGADYIIDSFDKLIGILRNDTCSWRSSSL